MSSCPGARRRAALAAGIDFRRGAAPAAGIPVRRRLRPAAALALLAAAVAAGCADEPTGALPPNLPPHTYLSVHGASGGAVLDTVNYAQVLRWWGSDPDGRVVGYLVRWDSGWTPPADARRWEVDPSWIVTTATADTFVLQTNGIYAEHVFAVRALDDDGAPDPVGRSQRFRVENRLPSIAWSRFLARPARTLPAVAFAWHPTDPDGARTLSHYLYWLTREAPPAASDTFAVSDTLIALVPTTFGDAGERAGDWTLHVRAVDESGGRSSEIAHSWTVTEPAGEYLLIDCINSRVPGGRSDDAFFRAMMDSTVAGNYEIWDIEAAGGFRTGIEVYPLLSLFRGVAWYGGLRLTLNDPDLILNLQTADAGGGLRRYLEEGGRLLLSAQNAVGDSAGLTPESAEEIFGISEFFTRRGSPNVDLPQNSVLYTALTGEADSVLVTSSTLGAEFFLLDADVEALFTVPPGFLARAYPHPQDVIVPDQRTQAAALGVFSTRLGRAALTSFIPSRANGYSNRDRIFAALFRRVLLP